MKDEIKKEARLTVLLPKPPFPIIVIFFYLFRRHCQSPFPMGCGLTVFFFDVTQSDMKKVFLIFSLTTISFQTRSIEINHTIGRMLDLRLSTAHYSHFWASRLPAAKWSYCVPRHNRDLAASRADYASGSYGHKKKREKWRISFN